MWLELWIKFLVKNKLFFQSQNSTPLLIDIIISGILTIVNPYTLDFLDKVFF